MRDGGYVSNRCICGHGILLTLLALMPKFYVSVSRGVDEVVRVLFLRGWDWSLSFYKVLG